MCFPWAVVEIKRGTAFHEQQETTDDKQQAKEAEARTHEKRKQFCYCQAANASAAGLTLREDLAASANDSSKLDDARVMFSFTCVGSAVKLWLTYRKKPVCPTVSSRCDLTNVPARSNAATKGTRAVV
jgi:hypothetical protein